MFEVYACGWWIKADTCGPIMEVGESWCGGGFGFEVGKHLGSGCSLCLNGSIVVLLMIEGFNDGQMLGTRGNFSSAHNSLGSIVVLIHHDRLRDGDTHSKKESAEGNGSFDGVMGRVKFSVS